MNLHVPFKLVRQQAFITAQFAGKWFVTYVQVDMPLQQVRMRTSVIAKTAGKRFWFRLRLITRLTCAYRTATAT